MLMSTTDPRGPKAVALATDAGQWIKCTDRYGNKAYGIPSSQAGRYYLVTRESCTCPAFEFGRGRDCKHIVAVKLHCELAREQEQAAKYDDIFARFDDDPKPLLRILGRPHKGVIPAHLIERED